MPHPYPGQEWKHGWVPLSPGATLEKNHGRKPAGKSGAGSPAGKSPSSSPRAASPAAGKQSARTATPAKPAAKVPAKPAPPPKRSQTIGKGPRP